MQRRIGPHIDPPLAQIPVALAAMQAVVFQTTLRDPQRLARIGVPDADDQAAYAQSAAGLWGMAHASLLTNLASPDPRIRNGSLSALVSDANLCAEIGLAGACFHAGYQKGHTSPEDAIDLVARKLGEAVAKLKPGARLLIENGCEGSELGQTVAELGRIAALVGVPPEQLGVVLDTCHLHVAGFDVSRADAPERLAEELAAAGLADRLVALHLNDAQFECGSHRDRHAVPGEGTIGEGLRRLIRHPLFCGLPAILEIETDAVERGIRFLTS